MSSSEGAIKQYLSPPFCPPPLLLYLLLVFKISALFAPLSQYKWADITVGPPRARGFLQIETDSVSPDKQRENGNSSNRDEVQKSSATKTQGVVDSEWCSFKITTSEKKSEKRRQKTYLHVCALPRAFQNVGLGVVIGDSVSNLDRFHTQQGPFQFPQFPFTIPQSRSRIFCCGTPKNIVFFLLAG